HTWARSRRPAPTCAPLDEVDGDDTEDPADDRADHHEPDEGGLGVADHVVDTDLLDVSSDQEDQQDERCDPEHECRPEAAAVAVAEAAFEARLIFPELLPDLAVPLPAHAREPNRARAFAAISRSPLKARSSGASSSGSQPTSATSWACSGGMLPRRPER